MGCVCCSLGSFVSILLDALERISLCTLCAMTLCCILCTIIVVMVMGIGIGFHYCFVQTTVNQMAKAAKDAGGAQFALPENHLRRMGPVMRSVDRAVRRGNLVKMDPARERREADQPPLTNNVTVTNTSLSNNLTVYNALVNNNLTVRNAKVDPARERREADNPPPTNNLTVYQTVETPQSISNATNQVDQTKTQILKIPPSAAAA